MPASTIQIALNKFHSYIENRAGITEFQLIARTETEEFNYGNDRNAFYGAYASNETTYAILDRGLILDGQRSTDVSFTVRYEGGNTNVDIALPNMDSVNKVIDVFDQSEIKMRESNVFSRILDAADAELLNEGFGPITDVADRDVTKDSTIEPSVSQELNEEYEASPQNDEEVEVKPGFLLSEDGDYLLTEDGGRIALEGTSESTNEEAFEFAVRALADNPSEVDLLGFEDYARALVDYISSEKTEKPLTLGIDAEWGMGKTTLMRMIRKKLEPNFKTVWFNAWKYDQEDSLWAALALAILNQIRKELPWYRKIGFWIRLRASRFNWVIFLQDLVKNLIYIFVPSIIGIGIILIIAFAGGGNLSTIGYLLVGLVGAIPGILRLGKETLTSFEEAISIDITQYLSEPDYKDRIGFFARFENDFKKIIKIVTHNGKYPLIVFIDDLDRCAPPKSAEIIEAINILLDAKHCVFVLGMDADTVAASIEAKYKDLGDARINLTNQDGLSFGQRFLEKIVQINFQIPKSDDQTIEGFITESLKSERAPVDEEQKQELEEKAREVEQLILTERRSGETMEDAASLVQKETDFDEQALERGQQNLRAKDIDEEDKIQNAIQAVRAYLDANPRKIKKFINLFRLKAFLANRRGLFEEGLIDLDTLAKTVVLETQWPDVVEPLIRDNVFRDQIKMASNIRKIKAGTVGSDIDYRTQVEREKQLKDAPLVSKYLNATQLHHLIGELSNLGAKDLVVYFRLASNK